jgi:hypothetical protein
MPPALSTCGADLHGKDEKFLRETVGGWKRGLRRSSEKTAQALTIPLVVVERQQFKSARGPAPCQRRVTALEVSGFRLHENDKHG